MQNTNSLGAGNGDVIDHSQPLNVDDIISDDEDVIVEEEQQPQARSGVFSKFRSVCQNVFQSIIGGKPQRQTERINDNTSRIIRRRSRQTLIPASTQRKPSEPTMTNQVDNRSFVNQVNVNLNNAGSASSNAVSYDEAVTTIPSLHSLQSSGQVNYGSREVGSRLAVSLKRGHGETQDLSATPAKRGDTANQYTAPWSALKQRRVEDSVCPADTSVVSHSTMSRAAPVVESTSLLRQARDTDRYSSMTLPSSHSRRPISRDFGSALSGESSKLATPLGAKRRVSLFETKTMTPHFNADKMESQPYATLDRLPARSSPLVGISSPRIQSPLAPRVVRLDMNASRMVPHSRTPLLNAPPTPNPTAQRLAKAYQQLTSSSAKSHITPVDPTKVHLIDPAQFFSKPKTEISDAAQPKVEPVTIRPVEPSKPKEQSPPQKKPAFRFSSPSLASHEPLALGKVSTMDNISTKFKLSAPEVLVESNNGSDSIWTCADCDIANSNSNDYCFSCGFAKSKSFQPVSRKTAEVAFKRQKQDKPEENDPKFIVPASKSAGPSATSTPFVTSSNSTVSKKPEPAVPVSAKPTAAPTGGVVGQWRCNNCFYMNDFKAVSCTRCSRSSSNGVFSSETNTSTSTNSTPAVGASSRLKRRATMEGGWLCGCQHMNPRSATCCDLCSAPKPQTKPVRAPVLTTTAPSTKSIPAVSAPSSSIKPVNGLPDVSGKLELPAISLPAITEAVKLTTATATTTSVTAPIPAPGPAFGSAQRKSESTETSKEPPATSTTVSVSVPLSSTGFGNLFAAKEGEWECGTCMIRNPKDNVKCAACETPNPKAPKAVTAPAADVPKFGMAGGQQTTPGGFSFGVSAQSSSISFGIATTSNTQTSTSSKPSLGGFKFGATPSSISTVPSSAPQFTSGTISTAAVTSAPASTTTSSAPAFSFGSLAQKSTAPINPISTAASTVATTSAPAGGGFAFNFASSTTASSASALNVTTAAPVFGSSPASTASSSTSSTVSVFSSASTAAPLFPPASSAVSAALPAFGSSFGTAPQPAHTGGIFGSTAGSTAASSAPLFPPATTSTAPVFSFGASSTPASSAAATTSSSTGFAFGSAIATPASSAPSSGFTFGASSSAAPSSGTFSFGSNAPAAPAAPAASAVFNFGSTAPATTTANSTGSAAAPFSFGGAPAPTPATSTTNGAPPPGGLFAFGSSAPATGGSVAAAPAPFAFGSLAPQPAATSAPSAAPAFNFASSGPTFGSTTTANNAASNNATPGGFKFDSPGGFNFSAGNPPSGPAPAATPQQSPGFSFGNPAPPVGGGFGGTPSNGPMLFSSGATQNRPKATAARKLKVAGRK